MKKFTFATQIYGCSMNIADAQRVAGVLAASGGEQVADPSAAEVVIFVTCSVRQKGEERVKGKIHEIRKTNPGAKIGLTGCMIHHSEEKLLRMIPELDFVFVVDEMWDDLPAKLNLPALESRSESYFGIVPELDSRVRGFVPIMSGCDNFCSYCIVPYARGREWSDSLANIKKEVARMLNLGLNEIFLLGQNVNSYKCPATGATFPQLLRELDELHPEREWWLRFTSPHPKDLSDELVACFAELKHLTPWMHLPIQAGADEIIRKMNRHYTVEQFAELVSKLRAARPDIAISTDVIVGFPSETADDFAKTVAAWERFQFDFSFIAQYSVRPGTAAAQMADDVSADEKKRRWCALNDAQKKISRQKLAARQDREVVILVEKVGENFVAGKTAHMQNVRLNCTSAPKLQEGDFAVGKITRTMDWACEGELLE